MKKKKKRGTILSRLPKTLERHGPTQKHTQVGRRKFSKGP